MTNRESSKPSALDNYLFDLRGYLILKNCLSKAELSGMNAWLDEVPKELQPGEWHGHVHCQNHEKKFGMNLQQIYEAQPFRCMIDHPSWIEKVKHYVGGEDTFDWHLGPLFIDENFAILRGPGQGISIHSGGETGVKRCQYRYHNGRFQCGQVNILLALTDTGPGDGATMVIPGSHKANLHHPQIEASVYGEDTVEGIEGAVEVYLEAGDAVMFVDAIAHGSAERKNPGTRRNLVFRYGPSWGNFRFGYAPSDELLESLSPEARSIVQPQKRIPKPTFQEA